MTFNETISILTVSFGQTITALYVFSKIMNFKNSNKKKIGLSLLTSAFAAVCAVILRYHSVSILNYVIGILICATLMYCFTDYKFDRVLMVSVISFGVTYTIHYVTSLIISMIAFFIFYPNIIVNWQLNIVGLLLDIIIAVLLFKIKRFKNGWSFLQENKYSTTGILISIVAIFICAFFSYTDDSNLGVLVALGIIICAYIVWFWVRRSLSKTYRDKMAEREVSVLQEEIDTLKEEKETIVKENLRLAKVLHEYNHKISALQEQVNTFYAKVKSGNFSAEIAEELSVVVDNVNQTSENYLKNVDKTIQMKKEKLPSTNVASIDNMFSHQQSEAAKADIEFLLKVTGSVTDMVEKTIEKERLETLIADHCKDAIIAIGHSKNKLRSIICNIGIVNNCYEFSVTDSGIPFEPETLMKLGKEAVTTHKDTGGTGIGFMTTFETMEKTGASLIITELTNEPESFSKTIAIRFDGLKEYRIKSHRAGYLKVLSQEQDIHIEKL